MDEERERQTLLQIAVIFFLDRDVVVAVTQAIVLENERFV
jgi:hypothetical protein